MLCWSDRGAGDQADAALSGVWQPPRSPQPGSLAPALSARGDLTRAGLAMASADAPRLSLGPGDARLPRRQNGHSLRTDPRSPLALAPKPPPGPVAGERGCHCVPQRPLQAGGAAQLRTGASRGQSPFSTVTKRVEGRQGPPERL